MVMVESICTSCKHYRELKDYYKDGCDAFPDGFPTHFIANNVDFCNGDIKFECNPDKVKEYEDFCKRYY